MLLQRIASNQQPGHGTIEVICLSEKSTKSLLMIFLLYYPLPITHYLSLIHI